MDEYISREFMLKNLEVDKANNAEHCEPLTIQIMDRFIRYIKEFPAADVQPVNRWISVKDRLPEYDKIVLVWYSYDGIWGKTAGYGISWYHGKWTTNELNQTGDNLEVLYWMYAPEPPKDGDTE